MGRPSGRKIEQNPASAGGNALAVSSAQKPGRWLAMLDPLLRHWRALSLERKFLLTATLVVALSMATLGYWVKKRIRAGWLQGMAETGALYLEGFLAHHVQTLETSHTLPAASKYATWFLISNVPLSDA